MIRITVSDDADLSPQAMEYLKQVEFRLNQMAFGKLMDAFVFGSYPVEGEGVWREEGDDTNTEKP